MEQLDQMKKAALKELEESVKEIQSRIDRVKDSSKVQPLPDSSKFGKFEKGEGNYAFKFIIESWKKERSSIVWHGKNDVVFIIWIPDSYPTDEAIEVCMPEKFEVYPTWCFYCNKCSD